MFCNRIGSEKRPEKQHYVPPTPGPGTYTSTNFNVGKEGPKYTASKRPDQSAKHAPGPGDYDPTPKNVQTAAPQYCLGSEKRTMLKVVNKNPGPGTHEHKSELAGSKHGFGTSSRQPLKPDSQPGPGSYEY